MYVHDSNEYHLTWFVCVDHMETRIMEAKPRHKWVYTGGVKVVDDILLSVGCKSGLTA